MNATPQYLLDDSGKKAFVVLTVKEYDDLSEDLHDLAVMVERRSEGTITLDAFEEGLRVNGNLQDRLDPFC